jgi:hypothetical protein
MPLSVLHGTEMWINRLKERLTESEWMVSEETHYQCNGIRLWALYVGAFAEQAEVASTGLCDSAAKQWSNSKFAAQAKVTGLVSWHQVRERLRGIIHTDVNEA